MHVAQSIKAGKTELRRAKNPRKSIKRLYGYVFKHKCLIFFGIVGLLVSSLAIVAMPFMAGKIIDSLAKYKSSHDLLDYSVGFLILGVIAGFFNFLRASN